VAGALFLFNVFEPDPKSGAQAAARLFNAAQEAWVATQHYQDRPWPHLIEFWTSYNRHLLHLMEQVPEYRRRNSCRIGGDDPVTLEFLMIDYVRHLQHHWEQIVPLEAAAVTGSQSG